MQSLKYFSKAIILDILLIIAFIAWKGYGIEGAGNVIVAVLWLVVATGFIVGIGADKSSFKVKRPRGAKTYNLITDMILYGVLAFYGMYWLAGFVFAAMVMIEIAREREPKPATDDMKIHPF